MLLNQVSVVTVNVTDGGKVAVVGSCLEIADQIPVCVINIISDGFFTVSIGYGHPKHAVVLIIYGLLDVLTAVCLGDFFADQVSVFIVCIIYTGLRACMGCTVFSE